MEPEATKPEGEEVAVNNPEGTGEAEVQAEPETTLDEEVAQDVTPEVAVPAGLVKPDNAPDGDYLAVVNVAGEYKYTLKREEAIAKATGGGHLLRLPTDEEKAEAEAKQ